MRTCDLHRRRYLLATLLTLACLTLSAHRAAGQLYTQMSQTRSMRAEVTARVPGLPDVTDVETEESMELGSFNRTISVSATNGGDAAAVSIQGNGTQEVSYLPDSISGVLRARTVSEEMAGDAGGKVRMFFRTEFRVSEAGDVSYLLTGQMRSIFANSSGDPQHATGSFTFTDEDAPDPHGEGAGIIFGRGIGSDQPFDTPLQSSGILLAGHRYSLFAEVIANPAFLDNPLPPGRVDRSIESALSFTIAIPEPSACGMILISTFVLSRRHRFARAT